MSDRSIMVDSLSLFSFHPVLHDWCNKGCGVHYPVWDGVYTRSLVANEQGTEEPEKPGPGTGMHYNIFYFIFTKYTFIA